MYSYHNFLFPFRFDKVTKDVKDRHDFYKKVSFDDRTIIDKNFKNSLKEDDWIYEKFEVNSHLEYNEISYFYDFVKDSLFNTQDFNDNQTSYYFSKKIKDESYKIKIKDINEYNLELKSLTLRIFDTGIGVLSFEVENHTYEDLKDIYNINEYGRRIYPQFLSDDFNLEGVQDAFLPQSIEANGIKENFQKDYRYKDIQIASFISENLGNTFSIDIQKNKYFIQPIIDDRMFVISHIMHNYFSDSITKDYEENDDWYKYIFLDKYDNDNKNIQNSSMQKELTNKATYQRWKGYGTLYGISRYSFVLLTNDNENFSKGILNNHIKTIYFQMVILLLANRASILRFSDEITAISDLDDNKIVKNISNLYKNYLRFKNKLYFKEITAQEQGIELYDKAREIMRIDNDINDLSHEIMTLNSYAYLIQEKEEKEQMNKLTKLGTLFLPGTFLAGIFGMNIFGSSLESWFGGVVSLGSIIGITIYLSKIHNINIKEFIFGKKGAS